MGFVRWLGAILVTSALLVSCGPPPKPGGTTTAPAATTTTTGGATASSQATTAPPSTPAPVASATPAASASASGTPVATASGSPAAAGDLGDFANAEGMAGFEEVKVLKAPASSPDSIAKGKELFAGTGNCVSCHGQEGKGDGPAGAALDPKPRNLHAKDEYKYGSNDHAIYRTVFYGVEGTGMAPLEGVLTPEQIWNVVHYVQTLQGA